MRRFTLVLRVAALLLLVATATQAQVKLGDNPGTIDANALLELESTSKGMLFSRMTNAQMNAITTPATGMVVFNTTNNCLYIRRGAPSNDWFSLCNADPTTTTTGFQLPQLTQIQMTSITSPQNGMLVYNTTNNAVYAYVNGVWQSMVTTASNGLTKTASGDVQLGGTLTGNTTIAAGSNTLTITGNGSNDPFILPDLRTGAGTDSIVTLGAGGIFKKRAAGDLLNTTAWKIDGNSGTIAGTNFLGTTDDEEFVLKTNNTERLRVLTTTVAGNDIAGALAVGRTTANATFHLGGSMALPIATRTSAYTITATDFTVIGDCTTAGFTLTLPDPTTCAGRTYILIKGDATTNVLTFSRPISLSATQTMSSVNYNVRLHIQSDGTNWWLIARF